MLGRPDRPRRRTPGTTHPYHQGTMDTQDLSFDLEPRTLKVTVGLDKFVLCEASEAAAVRYENQATKAARMSDGKVVGVDGIADTEPLLVHLCLFFATADGAQVQLDHQGRPKNVPLERVKSWPSRVVKALFEKARELSDLDRDTEDSLKEQLARLQKRLAKIQGKKEADEGDAGNDPTSVTADTSDSAGS